MTTPACPSYAGYRFAAEIISLAEQGGPCQQIRPIRHA